MRYLVLILLGWYTNLVGQESLLVPSKIPIPNIQQQLQVFVDESGQLGIAEVSESVEKAAFVPLSKIDYTNPIANSGKAFWLKFGVANETDQLNEYWLNTSVYDSMSLYLINNITTHIQEKGLLIVYDNPQQSRFRTLTEDKYGFYLNLPPKKLTTFYLRIKNINRFESDFKQIHLQTLEERQTGYSTTIYFLIFNIAFFSILLFLALFSLFQYLQNKGEL